MLKYNTPCEACQTAPVRPGAHENLIACITYCALARQCLFTGNNELYIAILALLDGARAQESLHRQVGEAFGEMVRDDVFHGTSLPPSDCSPWDNRPAFGASPLLPQARLSLVLGFETA